MKRKPKVLVVCTGNSMRSQMAEGLLRADLGERIDVFSAGTHPSFVHPAVIGALSEIGIDISQHRSKSVNEFTDERLDLVITLCDHAAEHCPTFPHARKTIHRGFPDPTRHDASEDGYQFLTKMRDQMRSELRELVTKELNL